MNTIRKRYQKDLPVVQYEKQEKPPTKSIWLLKSSLLVIFVLVLCSIYFASKFNAVSLNGTNRLIPDPEKPLPPSGSTMKKFLHAAVSSDSQVCSEIGSNILRENGNIFDSAIATFFCTSLTQIQSMGLGGGFILNAYIQSQNKSITVDALNSAPKKVNQIFPLENINTVQTGPKSILVPGALKALWKLHQKYGQVSWSSLVKPSLELCNNGIMLTKHLYDSLMVNENILKDEYLRDLFVDPDTGKFKKLGSSIKLYKHCNLLLLLESYSKNEDSLEVMIARDLEEAGSIVSLSDIKNYQVKWKESFATNIDENYILYTPATPSTAIVIPYILNILKGFKLKPSDFDTESTNLNQTILTYHRIIEAFKHAFGMRSKLGDLIENDLIPKKLLSEEFGEFTRKKIKDEQTFDDYKIYNADFIAPNNHGTSHIGIITKNGAISLTSSINYYFGSAICGHRTGILFNNAMDDFSYPDIRSQNYFGLLETPTNVAEPGKRPLSSMSPLLLINKKTQNAQMVLGAAGGSKIISAVSFALIQHLWAGKNLKEIVDSPRIHHQLFPNEIEFEYGLISNIIEGLKVKKHRTKRYRNRGTILNALVKEEVIYAISDYRKDLTGVAGY